MGPAREGRAHARAPFVWRPCRGQAFGGGAFPDYLCAITLAEREQAVFPGRRLEDVTVDNDAGLAA